MRENQVEKIDTDVLVIGGGLAGCWAALGAREVVPRVILVDKAVVGKSGCSTFAAGVMLAPLPEDKLDQWMQEMVENGEFMNDQDWLSALLNDQMGKISLMESWGLPFERKLDGSLARGLGRATRKTRLLMFHGYKLMDGIRRQVVARGVDLMERIMVTDLLAKDGQVVGAVGRHTRSGEGVAFVAKAVVLASGHIGLRRGCGYVDNVTGDGVAMAYRAGVTLTDMEFGSTCNINVWQRAYHAGGINMYQGHGAYIVNGQGERFMKRYDPVLKERARTYTLGAAFAKEALEGRGPIYVDMRHLGPEVFEKFERVLPKNMNTFKKAGIDLRTQLIECTPCVQTPLSWNGDCGIRVGLRCQTDIQGLFGAGAVTKIRAHGTSDTGGSNLAYCCVSGDRAGREAGRFALESSRACLDAEGVIKECASRPELVSGTGPIEGERIIKEIKLVTILARYSFFKHAKRIEETLDRLAEIESELLPKMRADDPHELMKAMELKNYLTCAKLTYKAALLREESRGSLFREEFPNRDDRNWLKWITVKKEGDNDKFEMEPIPIERYPFKPKSLKPIPYPVQYYFKE